MSKLNIDQQTIKELFSNKRSDFLIPDYQRPYAWEETECQTLWDDIFMFAFPENDYTKFDSDNDEYFLGPIVTFKNDAGKLEIIDGQQRLTTLMLLLRAFYSKFGNMKDPYAVKTSEDISTCIWKTNEFGQPDKNKLKIDSEVSTDDDKEEFLTILKTGLIDVNHKSRYARTYRFFQDKINEFLQEYPAYFAYLPTRILNNCILLPIEAESQDTALRIFSTLEESHYQIRIFLKHSFISIIVALEKRISLFEDGRIWRQYAMKFLQLHRGLLWMNYLQDICITKERNRELRIQRQKLLENFMKKIHMHY